MNSRTILTAASLLCFAGSAHAGGIPASMLFSGDWSNAANWSTNPVVPNNGQPGAADTYNVSIINRVATLDQNTTITDLTLGHTSGITNAIANTSTTARTLNIEGVFNYAQGILTGNNTYFIKPSGQMVFLPTPSGQTKQLVSTLRNGGVVTVDFFTNLQSTAPGTHLINEPGGVININNSTTLSRTAGSSGAKFTNSPGGVVNVQSPGSLTSNWVMDNHGTINANASVSLNNGGTHTGAFNPGAGRTITFGGSGQTHSLSPASTVTGPGTVAFSTDALVEVPAANFNPGTLAVNNGDVRFATAEQYESFLDALSMGGGSLDAGPGGRFNINTSMNWNGGELDTEVVIGQNGSLSATATENPIAPRIAKKTLTNEGLANLRGNLNNQTDPGTPAIVNNGTFKTQGTSNITGPGSFVNHGTFETTTGLTTVASPYLPQAGSITRVNNGHKLIIQVIQELRGGLTAEDAAELELVAANLDVMNAIAADLEAKGTITFKDVADVVLDAASKLGGAGRVDFGPSEQFEQLLVNLGITKPGDFPGTLAVNGSFTLGSPGTLTVDGSFALGSTSILEYELGAPGSVEVDLLVVTGNLTLDGALNLTGLTGFGAGSYTLIRYSGTLTDQGLVVAAMPDGFVGTIDLNTPGEVRLVVTPTPQLCPGDLNNDRLINTADLVTFLGQFGTTVAPGTGADFNDDGSVNTADLVFFLGRFGTACP